eukprot:TRINITY_DN54661_c0_g1_i1.p1 TRINITY_DN54661_c0_g1~~TRINITY_DN54661_c0_g1_i1.p1  ORF type:complete len:478 (-),score=76.03 TRINITY_DN54661_c0_g1_i1:88-1413(-)
MRLYENNRGAHFTNMHMSQSRLYHLQQITLSQAALFRDDVRELEAAVTTVFRNEAIVCTLLVGVAGGTFRGHMMHSETPTLVDQIYLLSLCSSIACASMGVILALTGINMATECRKDMLLETMRLPIEDILAEVVEQSPAEQAEHFEHQGITEILKLPFRDRLKERLPSWGTTKSEKTDVEAAKADLPGRASKLEQAEHMEIMRRVSQRKKQVEALFEVKQHEWSSMERISGNFLFLSLAYLLNAFSGLVVGEWCAKHAEPYGLASVFLAVLQATVIFIANLHYRASLQQTLCETTLILIQIPALWAGLLHTSLEYPMAISVKLAQILLAVSSSRKTSWQSKKASEDLPMLERKRAETLAQESLDSGMSSSASDSEDKPKQQSSSVFATFSDSRFLVQNLSKVRRIVFGLMISSWSASLVLFVLHNYGVFLIERREWRRAY